MLKKNKLTFITNIPSPYNLDLFESLALLFKLNVYYFNKIETERKWNLNINSARYQATVFKTDIFHNFFQKINRNLYFNFQCMGVALFNKSDYFMLGGNYFAPNTILLLIILKIRNQKIFWYGEKLLPCNSKLKYYIKRIMISPINWFTKGIFAIGEKARISYESYGYKKPIFNTPYAINPVHFSKVGRNAMSFKSKKVIFLSSGSLIDRKGYDIAINAFNLLDDDLKNKMEYWILGDGPLFSELVKLPCPGLSVKFMGFIEPKDIKQYFDNASIFLLTSRYDGWGVVINEAISAGLAIIVTSSCGASEYVDKDGGFIVNCDAREISNKIEYLLLHPDVVEKYSNYNLEKAAKISSDSVSKVIFDNLSKF